jgi:type II secretory pathway component PulC
MTVVYKAGDQTFKANEILWAKRELVEAIVRDALVSQTEGFIDMIIDTERPQDITRGSVNSTLGGVPDSAHDFLREVMSELEQEVLRVCKLARYGAAVTGIKYDLAGDVKDIEVDVSVSFE